MSNPGNDDDIDNEEGQGAAPSESGLRPVAPPPLQRDSDADDEYEIVETDAAGKPINSPASEGRMSEAEGGQGPVIPAAGDGEQRGQQREPKSQRNARRRESRERTYQENERLRGEMDQMRQRLDAFQGTATARLTELGEAQIQQQMGRLDTNIAGAEAAYRAATSKIAAAMSSADNEALVSALEERDTALVKKTQLGNEKAQVQKMLETARAAPASSEGGERRAPAPQPGQGQQRQAPAPLPNRVQQYVRAFQEEHDWFNPNPPPDDIDSNVALAVDRAVAAAGFNPGTPDYWAEVDDRLRERLPHLYDDVGQQPNQQRQDGRQAQQPAPRQAQSPQQQQRRGPPTGGVGDRAPAQQNRKSVTISPARKEAMISSGAIGSDGSILDKKKYSRQLASYAEFDRTNAVGR